jgi:hypothetical protein
MKIYLALLLFPILFFWFWGSFLIKKIFDWMFRWTFKETMYEGESMGRHEVCGNSILGTMVMIIIMGFLGFAAFQKMDEKYADMIASILYEQKHFFETQNANSAQIIKLND